MNGRFEVLRRLSRSLRWQLLGWLVAPLALIAAFDGWIEYENADDIATLVTDRLLSAAASQIAEQIVEADGRYTVSIPPSALGIFVAAGRDRALYQVRDPNGALIAGYPDVQPPPRPPGLGEPVFYAAQFQDEAVRQVAIAAPVVTKEGAKLASVVVGETLREQARLVSDLSQKDVLELALLVLVAGALALFGLNLGLKPLLGLRDQLRARDVGDFSLLAPENVQSELRPLVEAFNEATVRLKAQVDGRRRFIDDAAHQLRTPLALMKTQAKVGLRAPDAPGKDEALLALDVSLDGLARLVNQLMALARSDSDAALLRAAPVDLGATARAVLDPRALRALDHGIDLSFDDRGAVVAGDAIWLAELIANLVDNAVTYVGPRGHVAVSVANQESRPQLVVEDDGPGIPRAERARVFDRFYRIAGASAQGSGLGLAIARQIAEAHRATIALKEGFGGRGLRVEVTFPPI